MFWLKVAMLWLFHFSFYTGSTHCKTFQLCFCIEIKLILFCHVRKLFKPLQQETSVREFPHNYSSTSYILELSGNNTIPKHIWEKRLNCTKSDILHLCKKIRLIWVIFVMKHRCFVQEYRNPLLQIRTRYFKELKYHLTADRYYHKTAQSCRHSPDTHRAAIDLQVTHWLQHTGGRQNLKLVSKTCASLQEIKNSTATKSYHTPITHIVHTIHTTFVSPEKEGSFISFYIEKKKPRVREELARCDKPQKPLATY